MESAEIEQALDELETRMERLRSLYEQYFMGIEKLEPHTPRKDVERRIQFLRREQIRNTALRFKFTTIVQRYNLFQQVWARTTREIENGTYRRDVRRAAQRFGEKEALTILGRKKAHLYTALAEAQTRKEDQPEEIDLGDEDFVEVDDDVDSASTSTPAWSTPLVDSTPPSALRSTLPTSRFGADASPPSPPAPVTPAVASALRPLPADAPAPGSVDVRRRVAMLAAQVKSSGAADPGSSKGSTLPSPPVVRSVATVANSALDGLDLELDDGPNERAVGQPSALPARPIVAERQTRTLPSGQAAALRASPFFASNIAGHTPPIRPAPDAPPPSVRVPESPAAVPPSSAQPKTPAVAPRLAPPTPPPASPPVSPRAPPLPGPSPAKTANDAMADSPRRPPPPAPPTSRMGPQRQPRCPRRLRRPALNS